MLKLYHFTIEVRDGESEYLCGGPFHLIAASSEEEAWQYAEEYAKTFFGEGSEEEDGWWWDPGGTRACRACILEELDSITVPIAGGEGKASFTIVGLSGTFTTNKGGIFITSDAIEAFLKGEDIDPKEFAAYLENDIPEWLRQNLKAYRER